MISVSYETQCGALNIALQVEQKRQGRRKHVRHGGTLCCRCLENPPISKKDRMCRECRKVDRRYRRIAGKEELKRLRALESQINLSKGNDNGQSDTQEDHNASTG
jgi:hypothetical protein